MGRHPTTSRGVRLGFGALAYVGLACLIFVVSPPGSFIYPDSSTYIDPAVTLASGGTFESQYRLPGYPLLLASIIELYGADAKSIDFRTIPLSVSLSVVVLQALLMFLSAFMAAFMAERIKKGAGTPTVLIACLSPSALLYPQVLLPDVLFTFLTTSCVLTTILGYRKDSITWSAVAGLSVGLAAITRGNGIYLLPAVIILFVVGPPLAGRGWPFKRAVLRSVAAGAATFAVILPLMLANGYAGRGFALTTTSYKHFAIHDNVIGALKHSLGMSESDASNLAYARARDLEKIPEEEWLSFELDDRHGLVARNARALLEDIGPWKLFLGMLKAGAAFLITADGRGWAENWQEDMDARLFADASYQFSLSAVVGRDPQVTVLTTLFHGLSILFVVVVRMMNLVGVVNLVTRRHFEAIVVVALFFLVIAGTSAFIGYSRYRLPVDPLLAGLAGVGILLSWRYLRGRAEP